MNLLKNKKVVIPGLIVLSLLVWSRNIYLLFVDSEPEEEQEVELNLDTAVLMNDMDATLKVDNNKYTYAPKYRDPFKPWFNAEEQTNREQSRQKPILQINRPKPIPPQLRFCGIIQDEKGNLAVLEGPAGEIFYIQPGDTVSQVKIINITRDSLSCQWDTLFYKIPMR